MTKEYKNNGQLYKVYRNKIGKLKALAIVLVMIAMVMPTIISSTYSVMVADDFSAGSFFKNGYTGFKYIKYYYNTWQGTYTGLGIIALLSPALHGGLNWLRIIAVCNAIALFISFEYLIDSIICYVFQQTNIFSRALLGLLSLYMFTSYNSYYEGIYWFTGIAVYTIPLIITMVGLGLFIRKKISNAIISTLLISILGFLGMGGSLIITGFGCYALLMSIAFFIYMDKKIDVKSIVMFAVWLVGAFINVLAPGNYARHDVVDSTGVHPFEAILTSIKVLISRIEWFGANTSIWAVILIMIICGLLFNELINLSGKTFIIIAVAVCLMPVIAIFPVALGQGDNMPNRVMFILDLTIYIASLILTILVIDIIKKYVVSTDMIKLLITILVIIACTSINLDRFSYENNVTYQIACQLKNNVYKDYNYAIVKLFDKMQNSEKGSDVYISGQELPADISNYKNFYLDIDSNDWVNIGISDYYGLNSVTLVE